MEKFQDVLYSHFTPVPQPPESSYPCPFSQCEIHLADSLNAWRRNSESKTKAEIELLSEKPFIKITHSQSY